MKQVVGEYRGALFIFFHTGTYSNVIGKKNNGEKYYPLEKKNVLSCRRVAKLNKGIGIGMTNS